jgi:F-type H+-transporting ATPase subunit b
MEPLLATVVLAQENGDLQLLPDAAELIWGAVAFTILMAFMGWKVFPRLNATLDERAAKIQGQIEDAEAVRGEAEQLRRQYEEQLAGAKEEAQRITEEAREQAERIKSDARAEAERESQQLLARAREEAEAERNRVVQDLRGQVATLSVELAGRIVQRELDEERHRELVDAYISELSSMN